MGPTWQVIRWEIARNLRNKQFWIGVFVVPLLLLCGAGLGMLAGKLDQPRPETYYVVDEIGVLGRLQEAAEGTNLRFLAYVGDADALPALVAEENAAGYFVLTGPTDHADVVTVYRDKKGLMPGGNLETMINGALIAHRFEQSGLDPAYLGSLTSRATMVTLPLKEETATRHQATIAYISATLLFVLILSCGSMLLMSTLQEKRDRMVEVMMSSVEAEHLMQGKILGNFLLGLIQLGVWVACGLLAAGVVFRVPVLEYLSGSQILILLFFALAGYLFFAALFVGVGATTVDLQSMSNVHSIVFMLPMLGLVFIGPVVSNPDGLVAQVATFFPLTTALITILRFGLTTVPVWELVVAGLLLVLTTVLITRAAAKIFRVGMLMYGKSADLGEMWKWLRY